MYSEIVITKKKIDETSLAKERQLEGESGAVIVFLGVVRGKEGAEKISGIDYEAFEEMATHQFEKILDEIEKKWPIDSVRVVHRIGYVPVNTPSLWVEVTAGHRGEAFAACQYLIDEMKKRVPIWKHARATT